MQPQGRERQTKLKSCVSYPLLGDMHRAVTATEDLPAKGLRTRKDDINASFYYLLQCCVQCCAAMFARSSYIPRLLVQGRLEAGS